MCKNDFIKLIGLPLHKSLWYSWKYQNGEATNTNFKVFGLTRPRLEPMIYRTGGEHANHYPTDAVVVKQVCCATSKM
jgi:hypothetical protein